MQKKGLMVFVVIVCISVATAVFIQMIQSARQARKKSDEIMTQFKKIDKDLQQNKQYLDSLNKIYFDSLRNTDKQNLYGRPVY